jgi:probable F420-dependent oxidoreductase
LANPEVKLGVVLPSREMVMAGTNDAGLLLRVAEAAEESGFDSVWIGDSLFHRPRFDPLTMLGAVAARTTRVGVGTAVLLPALRHPLLLAHSLATLDRISNGRLVAGLGAGWVAQEFEAVGIPYRERLGRTLQTIKICREAWSGGDISKHGKKYWSLPNVEVSPKPPRPKGPPIWIGGSGPSALRAAGTVADGWMPTSPNPETFELGWATVQAAAVAVDRDPSEVVPAVYLTLNIQDDVEKAREETAAYAEGYYGIGIGVMSSVQGYFWGPADQAVEWLNGFVDAGARHLLLRFATLDPLTHLERAADKMLPALKA